MSPVKGSWDDLIGRPYRRGALGPDAYDCFGLAVEVLTRMGFHVNRDLAAEWISRYKPGDVDPVDVTMLECEVFQSPRKPGDLLVMNGDGSKDNRATHVGVHLGENLIIQSTVGVGVHIVPFRVVASRTIEVITWTD